MFHVFHLHCHKQLFLYILQMRNFAVKSVLRGQRAWKCVNTALCVIGSLQKYHENAIFWSPNVNAWYSHSVVTNTHSGSDRKTHIIEYTAVLTNRLCLPFIHHWLVQLYLPTTKKISFSALLCNVAFSVDNEHNAHGVGRASIWIMGRTRRTVDYSSCSDLRKTTGTLEGKTTFDSAETF